MDFWNYTFSTRTNVFIGAVFFAFALLVVVTFVREVDEHSKNVPSTAESLRNGVHLLRKCEKSHTLLGSGRFRVDYEGAKGFEESTPAWGEGTWLVTVRGSSNHGTLELEAERHRRDGWKYTRAYLNVGGEALDLSKCLRSQEVDAGVTPMRSP